MTHSVDLRQIEVWGGRTEADAVLGLHGVRVLVLEDMKVWCVMDSELGCGDS